MKTDTQKAIALVRSNLKKITDELQKSKLREELKRLKKLESEEKSSA